jgi:hypothetical protein
LQRAVHLRLVDQDELSAAFARAQLGPVQFESEAGDGMISARRNRVRPRDREEL